MVLVKFLLSDAPLHMPGDIDELPEDEALEKFYDGIVEFVELSGFDPVAVDEAAEVEAVEPEE